MHARHLHKKARKVILIEPNSLQPHIMASKFSSYFLNFGAQDFLLSYFGYCQIWLNILMDNCHWSNITKLRKKNKIKNRINDEKEPAKNSTFFTGNGIFFLMRIPKLHSQIHESSLLFNVCKRRSNTLVFIRPHTS